MVALEEILCVPGTVFFLQNGISMPVILKTKQNRKTAFLGGKKSWLLWVAEGMNGERIEV